MKNPKQKIMKKTSVKPMSLLFVILFAATTATSETNRTRKASIRKVN